MAFHHFQALAQNRIKFNLFLLAKLPSAFLCGVRLREINPQQAVTSVPFKWLSQNPFKSIYFACQAMAAELSTGVLAIGHLHGRKPAVSMLVTGLRAQYFKKATQRIYFTCKQGNEILATIEQAIATGEGKAIEVQSEGRTKAGELVSTFFITWSFKSK